MIQEKSNLSKDGDRDLLDLEERFDLKKKLTLSTSVTVCIGLAIIPTRVHTRHITSSHSIVFHASIPQLPLLRSRSRSSRRHSSKAVFVVEIVFP